MSERTGHDEPDPSTLPDELPSAGPAESTVSDDDAPLFDDEATGERLEED